MQKAQQVLVAVTTFSDERLRELSVTDVLDLRTSAPSLFVRITQSHATTSFRIRGVGTSSQNFGLESSVGFYVDGVYRARQSSAINGLVDIDAVEVLRGPQGTIFERNTPSGAIQNKTVAPNDEQTGFATVSAGNFDLVSTNAVGGSEI